MVLTDESPMPFGKHKGTKMANVPAKYLVWAKQKMYANNDESRAVLKYVWANWDAIEKEFNESQSDATESDIY